MRETLKSKYLNKCIKLSTLYDAKDSNKSNSSDDSDDDIDYDSDNNEEHYNSFIIDSTPGGSKQIETRDSSSIIGKTISLNPAIDLNGYNGNKTSAETMKHLEEISLKNVEHELKEKSVIIPGFEQQYTVKPFRISKRRQKKINRDKRNETKGDEWFNMPANEVTDDIKRDIMVLKMRKSLDMKRFYKKNDSKEIPKYFQIGTVNEPSADFYHSRVPKKDRKKTIVEELLADAEFRKTNRKKYAEAIAMNPYLQRMKRKRINKKLKDKGIKVKSRGGSKRHAKRLKRKK